jgi:hypothetical protein
MTDFGRRVLPAPPGGEQCGDGTRSGPLAVSVLSDIGQVVSQMKPRPPGLLVPKSRGQHAGFSQPQMQNLQGACLWLRPSALEAAAPKGQI